MGILYILARAFEILIIAGARFGCLKSVDLLVVILFIPVVRPPNPWVHLETPTLWSPDQSQAAFAVSQWVTKPKDFNVTPLETINHSKKKRLE